MDRKLANVKEKDWKLPWADGWKLAQQFFDARWFKSSLTWGVNCGVGNADCKINQFSSWTEMCNFLLPHMYGRIWEFKSSLHISQYWKDILGTVHKRFREGLHANLKRKWIKKQNKKKTKNSSFQRTKIWSPSFCHEKYVIQKYLLKKKRKFTRTSQILVHEY